MQTLPEVTPRKEPTEIIGSLFAVVVVISLNYPRANQCSRTIRERPHSGHVPGCQEEIRGIIAAYDRRVPHRTKAHPKANVKASVKASPKSRNAAALTKSATAFLKTNDAGYAIVA
jgi:hypothetical protein